MSIMGQPRGLLMQFYSGELHALLGVRGGGIFFSPVVTLLAHVAWISKIAKTFSRDNFDRGLFMTACIADLVYGE